MSRTLAPTAGSVGPRSRWDAVLDWTGSVRALAVMRIAFGADHAAAPAPVPA